jgi:hypothetical protein
MSDYEITEIGGLDAWREHFGGFAPARDLARCRLTSL